MDRAVFLNSSGAIVSLHDNSCYIPSLKIAPYVEMVSLPVVSVDSAALYGAHPENLATVTYSSGAALTFFCDSVAGGSDSSGDGSFDNPWRSMNTALQFLSCASCTLNAAAPYIQLKVKGTVDYVSGNWNPAGWYSPAWPKFILAGWDGQTDLTSGGRFCAGYVRDLKISAREVSPGYEYETASGCRLVGEGGARYAIDCEFSSGGSLGVHGAQVAYNCSGAVKLLKCGVLYRGNFGNANVRSARGYVCETDYAYSAVVSASATDYNYRLDTALNVHSAAVGVTATAIRTGEGSMTAKACIANSGTFLGGCVFKAVAGNHASQYTPVFSAIALGCNAPICSGGTYIASAVAIADDNDARAFAWSWSGYSGAIHNGVETDLFVLASAAYTYPSGYGYTQEREAVYDFGGSCTIARSRWYESGVLLSSSYTSNGGLCS